MCGGQLIAPKRSTQRRRERKRVKPHRVREKRGTDRRSKREIEREEQQCQLGTVRLAARTS